MKINQQGDVVVGIVFLILGSIIIVGIASFYFDARKSSNKLKSLEWARDNKELQIVCKETYGDDLIDDIPVKCWQFFK